MVVVVVVVVVVIVVVIVVVVVVVVVIVVLGLIALCFTAFAGWPCAALTLWRIEAVFHANRTFAHARAQDKRILVAVAR